MRPAASTVAIFRMKILVSGFERFADLKENPTERLIEALKARPQEFSPAGVELRAVLLPVIFAESFTRLEVEIRKFNPDVVVALGVAVGRSDGFEFERVAINVCDSDIPDARGFRPRDLNIDPKGPPAYFSTLPIRSLVDGFFTGANRAVRARISNSAGTYVCNDLMYRLLQYCQGEVQNGERSLRRQAGFVHVPRTREPELTQEQLNTSMDFTDMERGLKHLLMTVAEQAGK